MKFSGQRKFHSKIVGFLASWDIGAGSWNFWPDLITHRPAGTYKLGAG